MTSTYGSTQIPTPLKVIRTIAKTLSALSPRLAGYLAYQMFQTPMKRETTAPVLNPRTFQFEHNGRTINAYEWDGSGKTVMLVHGWESAASRFNPLIRLLVEQGYRVVAMDAPAHGASTGRQTNPLDYSEVLYDFTKRVGEVDALIAHSFGGGATMFLLDQYDVTIDRIVLVASINHVFDAISLFAETIHLSDAAFAQMQDYLVANIGQPLESVSVSQMATRRNERALIVHDTTDNIVSAASARQVVEAWHGATYHETQGLGHRRILKHRATMQAMIEFIEA